MRVSQLLHAIDRDDEIVIEDYDKSLDEYTIYSGRVRGIHRDNPINKMHVVCLSALDDVIYILVRRASNE